MTPFDADGQLALDRVEPYLAWQAASGVKGIYVLGTWGGFALLDLAERRKVAEAYCAAAVRHKLEIIVHIGTYAIKDALELGRHAIDQGADAVSSVVPQYYSTAHYLGLDDYKRYFAILTEGLRAPLYLYNNPRTTAVLLSPEEFVSLCEVGVAGVKDGAKNIAWITQAQDLLARAGLYAEIIPGNSIALVYGRLYGCPAVTSGAAVAFPAETAKIHKLLDSNDVAGAINQHRYVLNLRKAMGLCSAAPVAAHSLLRTMGQDLGFAREPWPRIDEALLARINEAVEAAHRAHVPLATLA
jgi:dihydrodipicolinate synthase/N-acetylneuraminate lyase